MKYYAKIEDTPLSDLLRQASVKSENQLVVFSDCIWQDFQDTGKITGLYIVFNQGVPIDNFTHIPGPVSHYSSESDYNAA